MACKQKDEGDLQELLNLFDPLGSPTAEVEKSDNNIRGDRGDGEQMGKSAIGEELSFNLGKNSSLAEKLKPVTPATNNSAAFVDELDKFFGSSKSAVDDKQKNSTNGREEKSHDEKIEIRMANGNGCSSIKPDKPEILSEIFQKKPQDLNVSQSASSDTTKFTEKNPLEEVTILEQKQQNAAACSVSPEIMQIFDPLSPLSSSNANVKQKDDDFDTFLKQLIQSYDEPNHTSADKEIASASSSPKVCATSTKSDDIVAEKHNLGDDKSINGAKRSQDIVGDSSKLNGQLLAEHNGPSLDTGILKDDLPECLRTLNGLQAIETLTAAVQATCSTSLQVSPSSTNQKTTTSVPAANQNTTTPIAAASQEMTTARSPSSPKMTAVASSSSSIGQNLELKAFLTNQKADKQLQDILALFQAQSSAISKHHESSGPDTSAALANVTMASITNQSPSNAHVSTTPLASTPLVDSLSLVENRGSGQSNSTDSKPPENCIHNSITETVLSVKNPAETTLPETERLLPESILQAIIAAESVRQPSADRVQSVYAGPIYSCKALTEDFEFERDLPAGLQFVDTHCHLDMLFDRFKFTESYDTFKKRYSPTYSKFYRGCITDFCFPNNFISNMALMDTLSQYDDVKLAIGVHPHQIDLYTNVVDEFISCKASLDNVVAFGEMGLDYSGKNKNNPADQKQVFRRQLRLAQCFGKTLLIHSRDADADCFDLMKQFVPHNFPIHLHCFMGTFEQSNVWSDYFTRIYFGVTTGICIPRHRHLVEFVKRVPLNRIVVETDAPYFLPDKYMANELQPDGLPCNHPGLASLAVQKIAEVRQIPLDETFKQILRNTQNLYDAFY